MEKSIEAIWKEGFLDNDALVAPKLNDLYNKKSNHIVDKIQRMFTVNLRAIVISSFIVLIAFFWVGVPVMGVLLFLLLNGLAFVNKKLLKGLEKIDKNVNSYQYLKSFDTWMKKQLSINKRMARFYYPYIFLSIILGLWFGNFDGNTPLGETLVQKLIVNYPDTYLIFGLPLWGILGVIFGVGLLAFFGGQIYEWDVNLVYGRVFNKLDEIIAEIEILRR